jgi:diguanylate cyclase (GGDEF)-like protein
MIARRGEPLGSAAVLTSALDEVEYGIVLLDMRLRAQFINRAYYRLWSIPQPAQGQTHSFMDLVEHARAAGLYNPGPQSIEEFVRNRIGAVRAGSHLPVRLRLTDGRVLKIECIALPDGGRVLEEAFLRAARQQRPLSVLMIDADHFKEINDRHGHLSGDQVFCALAERCRALVRQGDVLGGLDGEEFALVLADTDMPGTVEAAERLRQEIAREPFVLSDETFHVTVSVGIASLRPHYTHADELPRSADRALYAAKDTGRNCVAAAADPQW